MGTLKFYRSPFGALENAGPGPFYLTLKLTRGEFCCFRGVSFFVISAVSLPFFNVFKQSSPPHGLPKIPQADEISAAIYDVQ